MSTLTLQLGSVDWRRVAAVGEGAAQTSPRVLADALSLSALFTDDFQEGLDRIARAREAEPLNPIHAIRQILLLLRFGESGQAIDLCRLLEEKIPGFALPAYLRALAAHRAGESKRAAIVAAEVVAAHPAFASARFLQAEAQLRSQFKGLRKLLTGLPRGRDHASAWLDLTAKLILSSTEEGKTLASEIARNAAILPPGSRERELGHELIELRTAGLEELERRLAAVPKGSRAEELVLLFYAERLREGSSPASALETLRKLSVRFPDRGSVRRVYVAWLARLAVELSVQEKYAEALRVVERCLQLDPHETVHYQNRAALFTLLREPAAYHDAWYELERHQFRLALLGRVTAADAAAFARPHRLFAQQARLPVEGSNAARSSQHLGFLMETARPNEATGAIETTLAVNNDRINDDPQLLRQWVHHRRAELTFAHWAVGGDPRRFLLDPENLPAVRARLAGLVSCARSLEVLVPEEGRLLASRLVALWNRRAGQIDPAYAPPLDDMETRSLKLLHLETFADLALLCLTWKPDCRTGWLAEEVLALLEDEGPFFDDVLLREMLDGKRTEAGYPLKLLRGFMNDALGLDPARFLRLTDNQRSAVVGRLAAELLTRLAYRTYEEQRGTESGAVRALAYVERARRLDPDNIRTELTRTRFLLIVGRDDEARATLAQLHRSARAREPEVHSEIEELRRILDERGSSGVNGPPRASGASEVTNLPRTGAQVADLEAEIDRFPGSIQPYEELARRLAADGRFQDAVDWSERAMTQCLGRDGQLRARSLNLETLGLRKLAGRDSRAARLYATGAHGPALDVLAGIPESEASDCTVHFLHGQCLLAVGRPDDARLAFERALEHCGRQLHRTVLRGLAMDVDQPYLLVARRSIADKLAAGQIELGLREAWGMMLHLRRPEAALIDLAQIHLDAALSRGGTPGHALPGPTGPDLGGLIGGRLDEAYAVSSDLERARRLARLSLATHRSAARKAELILRKALAYEEQAALADVLVRSGELLREGDFLGALTALEGAGPGGVTEPRIVRQRALLLLKLERFQEAEAAAAALQSSASPVAREFLQSFPALAFRQRVTTASRLLRAGESAPALAVLEGAMASDQDQFVELAYCRGFGLAMDAYRLRRTRDETGAHQTFKAAMEHVEPFVAAARARGHSRLIELYETLDKELDHGF
jgi:tetratricopeptide (TPR) repeat protein